MIVVKGGLHVATLDASAGYLRQVQARRSNDYEAYMPGISPSGDEWKARNTAKWPRSTFADIPLGMSQRPPQLMSRTQLGGKDQQANQASAILSFLRTTMSSLVAVHQ